MNQAIHQVDVLLWLMGPVEEVFAYAGTLNHQGLEVEDTLLAVLRYQSGRARHYKRPRPRFTRDSPRCSSFTAPKGRCGLKTMP